MSIRTDLLQRAHKAKRMRNLFRSNYAKDVTIPVISNGKTVVVPASDIAATFDNVMRENLDEFCSFLNAEEVVSQAYRIVNITRDDVRGSIRARNLKELEEFPIELDENE